MNDNPYAAPQTTGISPVPTIGLDQVKRVVGVPATSLIVLATIAMLLDIAVIAHAVSNDAPLMLEQYGPDDGRLMVAANVGVNCLLMLVHAVVLIGAVNMLRVRTYSIALTSAALSVIPFCSPTVIIGIPFGIWALVALSRSDVKEGFRANAAMIHTQPGPNSKI